MKKTDNSIKLKGRGQRHIKYSKLSMNKFLIIEQHPQSLSYGLKKLGFEPDERPGITYSELFNIIHEYVGIVISGRLRIDRMFLNMASNLRYILRPGSGMENIDRDIAQDKGVLCVNSPEGNRDAVAEHAMGMLLAMFNKLPQADKEVRHGIWLRERNRGIEISGKKVGIIGYGNMGQALAKRLSSFDAEVLAYDKYKTGFDEYAIESSMHNIYERADIVSLHLPLTKETFHFADDKFFRRFRKAIYFVNTSRGQIVKTRALINALMRGSVRGACLDVLENEKLHHLSLKQQREFEYLRSSERVLLSPHVAGWSQESKEKMISVLLHKFEKELVYSN